MKNFIKVSRIVALPNANNPTCHHKDGDQRCNRVSKFKAEFVAFDGAWVYFCESHSKSLSL